MNDREFQDYVIVHWKSWNEYGRVIAALGLCGEAGEAIEHIKKDFRGDGPIDYDEFILELGDVLHYLTVLAAFAGATLSEVMSLNVAKLDARYNRVRPMSLSSDNEVFK